MEDLVKLNTIQIKKVEDIPSILPNIEKAQMFNILQKVQPIANLLDKEFKIIGIVNSKVEYEDETQGEDGFVTKNIGERDRLVIMTEDAEAYSSYSETFNKSIMDAMIIFGQEIFDQRFILRNKMKNGKLYYNLTVLY